MTNRFFSLLPQSMGRCSRMASLACLTLASSSSMAYAGNIYVDRLAPGVRDGSDWQDAFHYLEDALAVATSSDSIMLAEGVYLPGANTPGAPQRTDTFSMTAGAKIYGGYLGHMGGVSAATAPNEPDGSRFDTVLSGDNAGTPLIADDDVYNVVTVSGLGLNALAMVTLDGVRVSNGYADGTGSQSMGGGILVEDSWLFFADGFVRENYGTVSGGGVEATGTSQLDMVRSRVRDNIARGSGGGIHMQGNTDATLFNIFLAENQAQVWGGGLRFTSASSGSLQLVNSVVRDNQAKRGGGLSMDATSEGRSIVNCTIAYNTGDGSGVSGAGIHVNTGTMDVNLQNSIVFYNPEFTSDDNIWSSSPSDFIVEHSDFGQSLAGLNTVNHNLSALPGFVNGPGRILRLGSLSPCLEAGNDFFIPGDILDVDEDGDTAEKLDRDIRINAAFGPSLREIKTTVPAPTFGVEVSPPLGIVDMGAYEMFFQDDGGDDGPM